MFQSSEEGVRIAKEETKKQERLLTDQVVSSPAADEPGSSARHPSSGYLLHTHLAGRALQAVQYRVRETQTGSTPLCLQQILGAVVYSAA